MKKDKRIYLRGTSDDKRMAKEIAKHYNVSESDAWRIAIKQLYDQIKNND